LEMLFLYPTEFHQDAVRGDYFLLLS